MSTNAGWMSELASSDVTPPRREELADLAASRPFFEAMSDLTDLPAGVEVTEHVLRERDGVVLTAEVYRPSAPGTYPLVVHLHGGGYCVGSVRGDRKLAMTRAAEGYVVVSPEYGLAPEHPFPWAVEDTLFTARWAYARAAELGADDRGVILEGGSAGGGLAAAAAVALVHGAPDLVHDGDGDVPLLALVLLYGMLSFPMLYLEVGSNVGSVELWHRAYLGPHYTTKIRHPLASPLLAESVAGLPPTYLSCGALDAFLGHSLEMTKRLAGSGVATTLSVVPGLDHGYAKMTSPAAVSEMARVADWLATTCSTPTTPTPSTDSQEIAS